VPLILLASRRAISFSCPAWFQAKAEVVGRGDTKVQTHQVLDNVKAVIEAAGVKMSDVAKTTVFITDLANLTAYNEVYKPTFHPTRRLVEGRSR